MTTRPEAQTADPVDRLLKRVSARIPASVTPATQIAIHPADWLALGDEIEKLRTAIETHNTECRKLCNDKQDCGYAPYPNRRCPHCPVDWVIELAEQADVTSTQGEKNG